MHSYLSASGLILFYSSTFTYLFTAFVVEINRKDNEWHTKGAQGRPNHIQYNLIILNKHLCWIRNNRSRRSTRVKLRIRLRFNVRVKIRICIGSLWSRRNGCSRSLICIYFRRRDGLSYRTIGQRYMGGGTMCVVFGGWSSVDIEKFRFSVNIGWIGIFLFFYGEVGKYESVSTELLNCQFRPIYNKSSVWWIVVKNKYWPIFLWRVQVAFPISVVKRNLSILLGEIIKEWVIYEI